MKWKDLSLKERKQIYDSVRVNNPGATYFDIKQQFDSIPAYQDGKGKTINKADLPPEYRTGTPEYFERQRKMSGVVNIVQPEAYITPAGYIKDAINFIEDLGKGDYAGVAIDAILNLIPWGARIGRIIEGTEIDGASVHSSAPTQVDENMILEYTRNPTSNKMVKNQYDLYRNKNEYIDRLNKLIPMENLYPVYPIPSYKDGGIHIKKKNRGKFNALKKRTGKSTEELTHSKNPLTRKRAIFAQNAAKWNHKGRKKK